MVSGIWEALDMEFATSTDGTRLAYESAGSGDVPLVFVHGWCCDRTAFAPQVAAFARSHPVATLDLRGHGESSPGPAGGGIGVYADDVLAVAAAAGFERPVVVGHSMGALVALECAARGAARAAVLVDPAPLLDERTKSYFGRGVDKVRTDDGYLRRFAERMFTDHAEHRDAVVALMTSAPAGAAEDGARVMADFDGPGTLGRVTVPVLEVSSDEGEPGVPELCPTLLRGRVVGAGHFLQLQVPDQLDAMIARFLALHC